MRIVDAHWFADVNRLTIECDCGNEFAVRSDRWNVRCPQCRGEENLQQIRERYVMEHQRPAELSLAIPKVVVSASYSPAKGEEYTAQDPNPNIPQAIMDEIQQIVGNGLARVTVSADFGIKDFGTGASAMCSVSLTCNQDIQTIERAAKIAGDLARDLAQEQRQNAENELQGILSTRQGNRPPFAG